MTTEFDPQGRVYWGPHALSFPSAIWFDTSNEPQVEFKLNVGGNGSAVQYLTLATFDKTDPIGSLQFATSDQISLNGVEGVLVTQTADEFQIQFDTTTLTNGQIATLAALIDTGEPNSASNQGSGEGIFKQKSGVDLEFYSLDAVDGVSLERAGDVITMSVDPATFTSNQLSDLRQALLPTDAVGTLTNDGIGNLAWTPAKDITFSSSGGTLRNDATTEAWDLAVVADKTADILAQFMTDNPGDPATQALGAAISSASDAGALHDVLLAHYGANPADLTAMRSLLSGDTDTDTRVVLSFVDTDGDGADNVLRVSIFAVDPSTGNTTGTALSSTELPLASFASGSLSAQTLSPVSGDGSASSPITISDTDFASSLNRPLTSATLNTMIQGQLSDNGWQILNLQNSWTHFATPHGPGNYRKDALGTVHFRGVLTGGFSTTGEAIFVLPQGYRPVRQQHFAVSSVRNGIEGYCRLVVKPDGIVFSSSNLPFLGNAGDWISLSGVTFLAEA